MTLKRFKDMQRAIGAQIADAHQRLKEVRRNILNRRVLVVDDEPLFLGAVASWLESWGYHPLFAKSAEDALDVLNDCIIWVVLIDLKLPTVDGITLCRRIRHQCPLITCLAVTGNPAMSRLSELRAAGFEDCFIKPFDWNRLRRSLAGVFARLEYWAKQNDDRDHHQPHG